MSPERIREHGIADVQALAAFLGERDYFLGRPSSLDATAYAFLANVLVAPYESPIRRAALALPGLVRYVERMKERYYSTAPARDPLRSDDSPAEAQAPLESRILQH